MAEFRHGEAAGEGEGADIAQVLLVMPLGAKEEDASAKQPELHAKLDDEAQVVKGEHLEDGDEPAFIAAIPDVFPLATRSADRTDYILHPETGERLLDGSVQNLRTLRQRHGGRYNVQIVVSDGLNALAIMDEGHLAPFLKQLRDELAREGYRAAPEQIVLTSGRVRAGYRIGETLFADLQHARAILHVIGERPGTGHHTFSIYISAPTGDIWSQAGNVDHNITKVVSGVATTALAPTAGASQTVRILNTIVR